jgi:hypothetical protein
MPQPPALDINVSFAQDEAAAVSGRSTVKTADLDAILADIESFADAIRANIALLQRDDGELKDKIVKLHTLHPDVLLLIRGLANYVEPQIVTAAGTDTYTATLNPAPTELTVGRVYFVVIANGNTGPATLNVNGLGAKSIKTLTGDDLIAGELPAGLVATLQYTGTEFRLMNAPPIRLSSPTITNPTVSGTLTTTGAATLASLGVTANATVGGTLGVTGASTLASVGVTGNATVGGTLGVTGATTLAAVSASSSAVGYVVTVTNSNADPSGLNVQFPGSSDGATHEFLVCGDAGGTRAVLLGNGGLLNYQANNVNLSDARVKEISTRPVPDARRNLRSLDIRLGHYRESGDVDDLMLTAQQVQAVWPECVTWFNKERTLLGIRTHALWMRHLKTTQEHEDEIEDLKARVAALEAVKRQ